MSKLILVPTPIGNLGDITLRALEVLKSVDSILAEDTRNTGKLLKHFEIDKKMVPFHAHNEHRMRDQVLERLEAGGVFALVSDAGSPGISDPGYLLVKGCIDRGIEVESLPGATALIPALTQSGFPTDRFCFEGFLPPKKGRNKRLQALVEEPRTMVFYESPHRILKALIQFAEFFGEDRQASLSREITKLHEETIRGTLAELVAHFEAKPPKGEMVVVIKGTE
jgi:16S rRNA (cytidine1402-2'-O)-methyltransferase